jgi:hypothetical protein
MLRNLIPPIPALPAKRSHEFVETPAALAHLPTQRAGRHMRNARVSWW